MGNVIRLDAVHDLSLYPPFCLMMLTPWGGKIDVGSLLTGSYRIDVYITEAAIPPVYPPTLCGTKSFTVYDERYELHLPVVARQWAIP